MDLMNELQQEIRNFHEKTRTVLEDILEQYGRDTSQKIYKMILSPTKKLIQKCSFKSWTDTERLCSLAYWLYIYGNQELALKICELTHEVDFDAEFYWYIGLQNLYGLEVRIARELFGTDRRNNISPVLLDVCLSKRAKKEAQYPQILRKKEIASCDSMEKIEQTILEYIDFLKDE